MLSSRIRTATLVPGVFLILHLPVWAAATVNYQGFLYYSGFTPVVNGFAIAGTFAPTFVPGNYECAYGDDSACNMVSTHYSQAVADGNFLPIGAGTLTNGSGGFSGTGMTSAPVGTPIYLFLFNDANPDHAGLFALATSSDASYKVPIGGGSTTLFASQANSFVFGFQGGNGILVNILPIPEPPSLILGILGIGLLLTVRTRMNRAAI